MNAIEDIRVNNYKSNALTIAIVLIRHVERTFKDQLTNYERNLIRDFKMQLNEIDKIEKGRVK